MEIYKKIQKKVILSAVLTVIMVIAFLASISLWEAKIISANIFFIICTLAFLLGAFLTIIFPKIILRNTQTLLFNLNTEIEVLTETQKKLTKTEEKLAEVEGKFNSEERIFSILREMIKIGIKQKAT